MIQLEDKFIKKYENLLEESDNLIKNFNKIIEHYEEAMFESMIINYNDKKNDTSEKINSKLMTPMTPLDYYRYEDMKSREEAKQKEVADKRNEENNEG